MQGDKIRGKKLENEEINVHCKEQRNKKVHSKSRAALISAIEKYIIKWYNWKIL